MTEQRTERRTLDSDDSGSGYVDEWYVIAGSDVEFLAALLAEEKAVAVKNVGQQYIEGEWLKAWVEV
jgi:hypothetical protein